MRFALRVPVLNSSDQLHFESAWLCEAADCAYRDVVVEDPG